MGRPIYARRLNGRQRAALQQYYELTGWEPIGQEDYDAGVLTFSELWHQNVRLLEWTLADVTNTDLRGTGA